MRGSRGKPSCSQRRDCGRREVEEKTLNPACLPLSIFTQGLVQWLKEYTRVCFTLCSYDGSEKSNLENDLVCKITYQIKDQPSVVWYKLIFMFHFRFSVFFLLWSGLYELANISLRKQEINNKMLLKLWLPQFWGHNTASFAAAGAGNISGSCTAKLRHISHLVLKKEGYSEWCKAAVRAFSQGKGEGGEVVVVGAA